MFSFDGPVLIWVLVAIVSAVIEVSIPHFGVIFASLGAAAAAVVAGLGFGTPVQLLTFVIVLGASLVVLRPRLIGRNDAPGVPSRTEVLVGREGDWAARAAAPLPIGTRVRVVGADGIVLEVRPA